MNDQQTKQPGDDFRALLDAILDEVLDCAFEARCKVHHRHYMRVAQWIRARQRKPS